MRVEEIQLLVADVVLPPPDITLSQWADENRRLSSESAAERGEWRTDRAPYQRAIMDALSPIHPCEQVVLMSGARLGKTSILENFIGYIIDLDPGPVLLVQPREADCEAFSKDRLAPMLRDCGTLRSKVADARSRDSNNTILHNSPAAALPCRRPVRRPVLPCVASGTASWTRWTAILPAPVAKAIR